MRELARGVLSMFLRATLRRVRSSTLSSPTHLSYFLQFGDHIIMTLSLLAGAGGGCVSPAQEQSGPGVVWPEFSYPRAVH